MCRQDWDVPTQVNFGCGNRVRVKNLGLPFRIPFSLHDLDAKSNEHPSLFDMFCWNSVTPFQFGGKIRSISPPKKKGLKQRPNCHKSPMLAKEICRIGFSILPMELELAHCSCFSKSVVGNKMGSLGRVEVGMVALVTTALLSSTM